MFADYKEQVLSAFDQKKASGKLPFPLIHSTPANLKAECITVCEERFGEKDENLLRSFFGQKEGATAYRMAIKNCGAEKFKPLSNFLKRRSIQTDERNIELLAWLIDFEPRPYQIGRTYKSPETAELSIVESHPDAGSEIPINNADQEKKQISNIWADNTKIAKSASKKWRKILVVVALSAVFGGIIYYIIYQPATPTSNAIIPSTQPERCMYWAGDHYQPISCNQKLGDTPIIALDDLRRAHFKKITQPDTLSPNSVKKVWYSKINGQIEFFTSSGFHPVHPERRLLPLTAYILNKYVHHRP